MIKILLSLTTRQISLKEIYNELDLLIYKDFSLHICCWKNNDIINQFKSQQNKYNTLISVFSVGTSEESMLNNTIKTIPSTDFILIRNATNNFNNKCIDNIITEKMLGGDIILFTNKKKTNKISTFFKNLKNSFFDTVFNFNFYNGDLGIQYFSKDAHSIMKTTNANLLTKLNRWIGIVVRTVEMPIDKTRIESNKKKDTTIKTISYFALFALLFAGSIILDTFVNLNFIIWFLFVCGYIATFSLGSFSALNLYANSKIGELYPPDVFAIEILGHESENVQSKDIKKIITKNNKQENDKINNQKKQKVNSKENKINKNINNKVNKNINNKVNKNINNKPIKKENKKGK